MNLLTNASNVCRSNVVNARMDKTASIVVSICADYESEGK
jgi:hypothetical protein